jgi:hypothetical protein
MDRLPLSALLSKCLDAFSRELDARRDVGTAGIAQWANVLQHVDEEGIAARDLPRRARLSRRAVPPVLRTLERSGHLEVVDKRVRLTRRGRASVDAWYALHVDAERRWRRRFGAAVITSLRRELEHVVSQFELQHPDFPTQYGTADPRINGGPGQDWKPVHRPPGTTMAGTPPRRVWNCYRRGAGPTERHPRDALRLNPTIVLCICIS